MNGISYNHFVFDCINNSAIVWLSISYAYKGLLQILAMFMAFHTRKVKIKALNDSKEIAAIIYINSITLSLLAFVEFALNDYHEVYASLFGLALLVGATLFLTLLFVPKASFQACRISSSVCVCVCVCVCEDPGGSPPSSIASPLCCLKLN